MSSNLFDYLMKDREAELQTQFRQELQQLLEDTLLVRFPAAPLALVRDIRRIEAPAELRRLIVAVQQVPDLAAAEQLLREAAQTGAG
jgi:hypothetical protein